MACRLTTFAFLAALIGATASDWPQFMGPTRNGRSTETGLTRTWPDGGPAELWKVSMGKGFGGAAVVGDKVYIQDREGEGKDVGTDLLRCLDVSSGKELWRVSYDAPGKYGYPGARAVPAVVGNRVFSCGPLGHLVCVDTTARKIAWKRHVWQEFGGGKRPMWAFAQNPLVMGDLVIIQTQTTKAGVVAFEVATGKIRWQSESLGDRYGYVSPSLLDVAGRQQLIAVAAGPSTRRRRGQPAPKLGPPTPKIFGLDPATGRILWRHTGWRCMTPAPVPIDLGDGKLLLTGGYNSGSAILQVTPAADGAFKTTEILRTKALGSHVHPPIVIGKYVYGNSSDNGRKDGMVCMGLDGKLAWKTGKNPIFDKGGLLFADGMLISMDGTKGVLRLIDPNPEKLTVLAEAKVLNTPQCWGPLALANGRLLLRDQKQLKCLDLRKQ
jgi:outer membrane protein assembly factor BamB